MYKEGRFDKTENRPSDYESTREPDTFKGFRSLFFAGNQIIGLDDEDKLLFGVLMEKGVVSNNQDEIM